MQELRLLCCAVFLGLVQICFEFCDCGEKYGFKIVDCVYRDLEVVFFGFFINVITLSFLVNRLLGLLEGVFREVFLLQSLWLVYNEIRIVVVGVLVFLGYFKSLDFSYNFISDFVWSDLYNFSVFQLFKMDSNELIFIFRDVFRSFRVLRSLQFNYNRLYILVEGIFISFIALFYLQINDNFFDCICGIVWFKTWVLITVVFILEQDNVICFLSYVFKGISLNRLLSLFCLAFSVQFIYQFSQDGVELRFGFVLAFYCDVDGQLVFQFYWYIQTFGGIVDIISFNVGVDGRVLFGILVVSSRLRFQVFVNGSLLIFDFGKLEEGIYSCLVINELGSAESLVNVVLVTLGEGGEDALGRRFYGKVVEGKGCYTVDNEVQSSGFEDNVVIIYFSRVRGFEVVVVGEGVRGQ